MKSYETKSPQLTAFVRVRVPDRIVDVLPLPNNPSRAKFVISPADDDLYRAVAEFNSSDTTVKLADYLHELQLLRDRVRSTLHGCGRTIYESR